MKKFLSTNYSDGAFNFAMFVLRVGIGILMMHHGYQKLMAFSTMKNEFMSFLGFSSAASLSLTIFAEFFCSIFLIIGLFTRLTLIPLLINIGVAVFIAHNHDFFGNGEKASLYFLAYIVLFFVGPGNISVDRMIK
jgi:putative oxidoreductase